MHNFDQIRNKDGMWVFYARQSSIGQVVNNKESTRLQIDMTNFARQNNVPEDRIKIIDDLGKSGSKTASRDGFQELCTMIEEGKVAIVFAYDASRYSRNEIDWFVLVNLCDQNNVIIADQNRAYNPADEADRLLLGFQGLIAADDVRRIKKRLADARNNKARRGELYIPLPAGFCRREDGKIVKDPDSEVQKILELFFSLLRVLPSLRAVLRYFQQNDLRFPCKIRSGSDRDAIRWESPTYAMMHRAATNIAYAGVYQYNSKQENPIKLPNAFPAYISEEEYHANQVWLRKNSNLPDAMGAPKEGQSLLCGLLFCSKCGHQMYAEPHVYRCKYEWQKNNGSLCQSFSTRALNDAIERIFLDHIHPAYLAVLEQHSSSLSENRERLAGQYQLALNRARHEESVAQRRMKNVDPDQINVFRSLAQEWEAAKIALSQIESQYAQFTRDTLKPFTEAEHKAIGALASDLLALWHSDTTKMCERKQLIRLAIREIFIDVHQEIRDAELTICWQSGVVTHHHIDAPQKRMITENEEIISIIRQFANVQTDYELAQHLNERGYATYCGEEWTKSSISSMRAKYQIPSACPVSPVRMSERGDGYISLAEAERQLGHKRKTIITWLKKGVLKGKQSHKQSPWWVELRNGDVERLSGRQDSSHLSDMQELMKRHKCDRDAIWAKVRAEEYLAWRNRKGRGWEWRFEATSPRIDIENEEQV